MELQSPLSVASTFAEDFQLEYANGIPVNKVGWGRANAAIVNEMISLHTAEADDLAAEAVNAGSAACLPE